MKTYPSHPRWLLLLVGLQTSGACADPLLEPPANIDEDDGSIVTPLLEGWPEPAPCALDPLDATTLLITTTDFATGALSVVDTRTDTVDNDVALGSPDAIPFADNGRIALVHRFGYDFIDFLTPGTWTSRGQHALSAQDTSSPNPHALVFDDEGLAYVTLFGSKDLLVMDPTLPVGSAVVDHIDLSAFADPDGTPEASQMLRCGDTLWVGVERLDRDNGFARTDGDQLIAIDLAQRTPYDLDLEVSGGQGLRLRGAWLKQIRRDPTDERGESLLALTSGIERIDLSFGDVQWAVSPEAFAAAGLQSELQPISFDVSADGTRAWVAGYGPADDLQVDCAADPGPCFEQARLFEVDLTAASPVLVEFHAGLQAVERAVQRVGDTLWVGSRQSDGPGLYTFDLTTTPPTLSDGPRSTGLPPYSLTATSP